VNLRPSTTANMGSCKNYVLVAVSALFLSEGLFAAAKTVQGLDFELSPPPKQPCLSQPFYVWHEPDAFFSNLKEVKAKGGREYHKGHDTVANYPASLTVRVELWQGLTGSNSCLPLTAFDPGSLKFLAQWQKDSQLVPAAGIFLVSEQSSPPTWCEDMCTAAWVYELRIDSQDVPLRSNLVLTIATREGTPLAKYVGKLSTTRINEQQLRPSIYGLP
jgi:hypothetical protein